MIVNRQNRFLRWVKRGSSPDREISCWGNLGYWPVNKTDHLPSYEMAASRLADELVSGLQLNQIQDQASLLVLGCGYGEEVRHWSSSAPKLIITGVDPSSDAVKTARRHLPETRLFNVSALSYLDSLKDERFDLVCGLDCAYHFKDKYKTWQLVHACLIDRGVLAFTDLVIKSPPSTLSAKLWLRVCSTLFSIPFTQWQTLEEYQQSMQEIGFSVTTKEVISTEVLDGFCNYVSSPSFSHFESYQGRLKSRVTAYLIGKLRAHNLIDYVLIQAEKKKR